MLGKLKFFFSNYTNAVIVLLFITTFSGALRKWSGLPSLTNNISLLLLLVFPVSLLFFFKNSSSKLLNKNIKNILYPFIFALIILAFNPLNTSYFHGLLGIFIHLSFICILLSYFKNKPAFEEKKIIKIFFFFFITQLIIASIQYTSPTDSFINRYADNRQSTNDEHLSEDDEFVQASAIVGHAVRTTGTFSYLAGYTAILFFFLLFTFYLCKMKGSKYLIYTMPLIIYAALLSGSRGTVGFILILLVAFLITEKKLFSKSSKPIISSLIFSAFLFLINVNTGDKLGVIDKISTAYANFMDRVESSKSEGDGRLTHDLFEVFTRDFDYKLAGVGLGSTYQGANAIFGTSQIVAKTPLEGELFRIIVEGGILLLAFRIFLLIIIFSYLDIPLFFKTIIFLIFCIFSQNVFNVYNAIYFAIGLIVLNQAYSKKDYN